METELMLVGNDSNQIQKCSFVCYFYSEYFLEGLLKNFVVWC